MTYLSIDDTAIASGHRARSPTRRWLIGTEFVYRPVFRLLIPRSFMDTWFVFLFLFWHQLSYRLFAGPMLFHTLQDTHLRELKDIPTASDSAVRKRKARFCCTRSSARVPTYLHACCSRSSARTPEAKKKRCLPRSQLHTPNCRPRVGHMLDFLYSPFFATAKMAPH